MLLIRMLVQVALLMVALGAVLFGASGSLSWREGWWFLAETAVLSLAVSLWLLRYDPELLQVRLTSPFAANQAASDRRMIAMLGMGFMLWLAVMGLDRRTAWSAIPVEAELAGAVALALAYLGIGWTFAANRFAAPQIRVQTERDQQVISTGPYRFVRHPMYAGATVYLVGVALLLGSWWGMVGAVVLTLGFGVRALGEEAVLRQGLEGYDAYARRVRWRMLPGVW